jgi:hypothetical protein
MFLYFQKPVLASHETTGAYFISKIPANVRCSMHWPMGDLPLSTVEILVNGESQYF